jgi:hypothetical protein
MACYAHPRTKTKHGILASNPTPSAIVFNGLPIMPAQDYNLKPLLSPREQLIGVWSRGAQQETTGPGEWTITFREDGTGRYDDANYSDMFARIFRWSIPSTGRLTVECSVCFHYGFRDPIYELEDCHKIYSAVPYKIEQETTRLGRSIPVLRAPLFGFSPGLVGFGFETENISSFPDEVRLSKLGAPR